MEITQKNKTWNLNVIKCPKCGADNITGALRCGKCGFSFINPVGKFGKHRSEPDEPNE
ncbi:hypothetical protein KO465_03920 [Candidatus Micrarchaeota archaeon]|nr:hypothetical protein [Candidatus Micrarchaeota archaeon]